MADRIGAAPQAKGGHARAAKLDPGRRSEIATRAAEARWVVVREGSHPLKRPAEVRTTVSLRLSGALAAELDEAARAEGLSPSRLASRAVAEWLVRRGAGKKEE